MESRDLTQLKGKTISSLEWIAYPDLNSDDEPVDDGKYLMVTFTDGFKLALHGGYTEDYTGKSAGEYPTYLSANVFPPEGYNGPGMYETRTKNFEMNHLSGHQHVIHIKGQKSYPEYSTVRFFADSLEHAKSLLDLSEVEYVKWVSKPYNYDNDNGE